MNSILVLKSSDEHGLCYIDTQNLDGEANLKQREVPRGFVDRVSKIALFKTSLVEIALVGELDTQSLDGE